MTDQKSEEETGRVEQPGLGPGAANVATLHVPGRSSSPGVSSAEESGSQSTSISRVSSNSSLASLTDEGENGGKCHSRVDSVCTTLVCNTHVCTFVNCSRAPAREREST